MDFRRQMIDAVAELGRLQVSGTGAERFLGESGERWLQERSAEIDEGLAPERGAELLFELGAVAEPLLQVAGPRRVNLLLGRVLSLMVKLERSSGRSEWVMKRLLGADVASRAESVEPWVLTLNPSSSGTHVALFHGLQKEHAAEVHLPPEVDPDGLEPRVESIRRWLDGVGVSLAQLAGIASRCGFVRPVPTGTYRVVDEMQRDLENPRIRHASNLTLGIARRLAAASGRGSSMLLTVTDPVVSDEMEAVERLTGFSKLRRDGAGAHYLNHRAVWRLLASLAGRRPEVLAGISSHMGGGASTARHRDGQIPSLINAFAGVPSVNRSGALELPLVLPALKSGELTFKELDAAVYGRGGLSSLAGTNDFGALVSFLRHGALPEQRSKIDLILEFFARQCCAAMLRLTADGKPCELMALTGGLAALPELVQRVERNLDGRYPLVVVPGGLEAESLAAGLLTGLIRPHLLKDYVQERDALELRRVTENQLLDTVIFDRQVRYKRPGAPLTALDDVIDATCMVVKEHEPPRIAIVGANNEEAILAAKRANEEGSYRVAKFSLLGDFAAINEIAYDFDLVIDNDNYEIIDTDDPVAEAVRLFHEGHVQIFMKGRIKTAQILRGIFRYLKSSGRLRPGELISHVGVLDIPVRNKLLLLTDAAVNPYPSEEQRIAILENALKVARSLNLERPKVGVISAIESVNRSVKSSIEAERIAQHFRGRKDCIVEGPLSFDVAMDPSCASEKGYKGEIKGTADVLLMPDIDAGNVLYKTLTTQSKATIAGVILCGDLPMVLTSRGDSARSKLSSISMAVKLYFDLAQRAAASQH